MHYASERGTYKLRQFKVALLRTFSKMNIVCNNMKDMGGSSAGPNFTVYTDEH